MNTEEKLLREYELCDAKARALEAPIWSTSAVMGFGSVAAFLYILNPSSAVECPAAFAAGAFVVFLNLIWRRIAKRWWSIMHTLFLRMGHIESRVGVYLAEHYIQRRDALHRGNADLPSVDIPEEELKQLDSLRGYQGHGPRWYSGVFQVGNFLAWSAYIILRFPEPWRWAFLGVLPAFGVALWAVERIHLFGVRTRGSTRSRKG